VPLAVWEVHHCSDDVDPERGFEIDQADPESNQYPVAVVVRSCAAPDPKLVALKVDAEYPEPPPVME
jgi:hypothetical protein